MSFANSPTSAGSLSSLDQSTKSNEIERVMGQLLWNLDTSSLLQLRQHFHPLEVADPEGMPPLDVERHREKRTLYIGRRDFENAVHAIFGNTDFKSEANRLFQVLDYDRSGFIWWEQLLDQLIECGDKRTSRSLEGWMLVKKDKIRILDPPHCKRESISFVVPIETDSWFCYVLVSKHGKVGLYDGKLRLLAEYDVFFLRTGVSRRIRDVWITAAINLEDSKSLVLTASDRSLMVYDSSTLVHVPTYFITGIPHIPTYLAYSPSREKGERSCLVMGDDHGGISMITFKQPRVGLFFKQVPDKIANIIWIDLQCILQEPYCFIKVQRRVHSRPVKQLAYLRVGDCVVSCSGDPEASLVINHRKGIKEPYIFKVSKGISCFHYSVTLKLVATGSSDGRVRLWDPVLPYRPTAMLPAQSSPIMDVLLLPQIPIAISFNKTGELKVWDILNQFCIQSLHILFPSFGILGRLIQFGPRSIYNGPGRKRQPDDRFHTPLKRIMSVPEVSKRSFKEVDDGTNLRSNSFQEDESMGSVFERELSEEKALETFYWNRPEILVSCCNHIAVIPLAVAPPSVAAGGGRGPAADRGLLPPPEKTTRPRKPSVWDDEQFSIDNMTQPITETTSRQNKISAHILNMRQLFSPESLSGDEDGRPMVDSDDMSFDDLLKRAGLTDIFKKDFISKFGLKHDMNAKLALQKPKQEKMRLQVAQGAPYSALELQDPQEIKFSTPLPISLRMQKKSGLEFFTEPQQILRHNSCFTMGTPRSSYTVSSTTNSDSGKSNGSIRRYK